MAGPVKNILKNNKNIIDNSALKQQGDDRKTIKGVIEYRWKNTKVKGEQYGKKHDGRQTDSIDSAVCGSSLNW